MTSIKASIGDFQINLTGYGENMLVSDNPEVFDNVVGRFFETVSMEVEYEKDLYDIEWMNVRVSDEVYSFEGGYYVTLIQRDEFMAELERLRADIDYLMMTNDEEME